MTFSALLDTCVLVPSTLRDLLLELGTGPAYRPVWSNRIEDELARTVARLRAARHHDAAEPGAYVRRLIWQMDEALPDAKVEITDDDENAFNGLPDEGDRHVVAAAVLGRADVIVTFNLKDFPDETLPGELFSQGPDDFLLDLRGLYPDLVSHALRAVIGRTGRRGPRWDMVDLLQRLEREQLPRFVEAIRTDGGAGPSISG